MSITDHTEELEAEIIRKVYSSGFSHAENIMSLLARYQQEMSYDDAVARLHDEVMDE